MNHIILDSAGYRVYNSKKAFVWKSKTSTFAFLRLISFIIDLNLPIKTNLFLVLKDWHLFSGFFHVVGGIGSWSGEGLSTSILTFLERQNTPWGYGIPKKSWIFECQARRCSIRYFSVPCTGIRKLRIVETRTLEQSQDDKQVLHFHEILVGS